MKFLENKMLFQRFIYVVVFGLFRLNILYCPTNRSRYVYNLWIKMWNIGAAYRDIFDLKWLFASNLRNSLTASLKSYLLQNLSYNVIFSWALRFRSHFFAINIALCDDHRDATDILVVFFSSQTFRNSAKNLNMHVYNLCGIVWGPTLCDRSLWSSDPKC